MGIIDWLFGKREEQKPKEDKLTSVDLPSLPNDVDTGKLKKAKLIYDPIERRLSFFGKMSDRERSDLSKLSNDKRYKRAIRSLFLRSQGSSKEATWPLMSLRTGLGDKDFVYGKATLAPLKAGGGERFVDYISDALWNIPNLRNNALKILHLVSGAGAMSPSAARYAKEELADWEEEELHNNIVTVTKRDGLVEIACPECGAQCPSLLSADDPVLETRPWGADCPSCGRAFNFKVVRMDKKERTARVSTTHHIGERYGGGTEFYVDETGEHGLIAADDDQSTGIQWCNGDHMTTDATNEGVYEGKTNTKLIITKQSAGSYAAQKCAEYRGGGFSDWCLPSKDELNLLYANRHVISGIGSYYYWSSTEYSSGGVWMQGFHRGAGGYSTQGGDDKKKEFAVRAVRAF